MGARSFSNQGALPHSTCRTSKPHRRWTRNTQAAVATPSRHHIGTNPYPSWRETSPMSSGLSPWRHLRGALTVPSCLAGQQWQHATAAPR